MPFCAVLSGPPFQWSVFVYVPSISLLWPLFIWVWLTVDTYQCWTSCWTTLWPHTGKLKAREHVFLPQKVSDKDQDFKQWLQAFGGWQRGLGEQNTHTGFWQCFMATEGYIIWWDEKWQRHRGHHPLLDACSAAQRRSRLPALVPGGEPGCKNKGWPSAWVSSQVGGLYMATLAWRGATDRDPCIQQLDLINLLFSPTRATCTFFRGKTHPHPDLRSD